MPRQDERYILDLCDEVLDSAGLREHRFDWLRGDASAKRPAGTRLPVDSFWPELGLVVEFHERQHAEAVPFFDKPSRMTVSGVHRGEQRRLYDERRRELIPRHGLTLVEIPIAAFTVRQHHIVPNREEDRAVVARYLSAFTSG